LELLFEIGVEELPPSFVRPALGAIEEKMAEGLQQARLDCGLIQSFGTPRRLAVLVEGLAEKQSESSEVVFGPPASAAFDESGKPTKAAAGFAKRYGVDVSELRVEKKDKGDYVCAEVTYRGEPAAGVIPQVLLGIVNGLQFPKTMKWEASQTQFARPARWLVALLDGSVVDLSWANLKAGNTTRGHRFLSPGEFEIKAPGYYVKVLEDAHVIADHDERKRLIAAMVSEAASSAGGHVVEDDELLEIVNFEVEYPLAVIGDFDREFLDMPHEVVRTAMKEHQNFFSVSDGKGNLLPKFVAVANTGSDPEGFILRGNERVLKARLADALFYWQEDRKTGLEAMAEGLERVVWQEALGTLAEKSERIAGLARAVSQATGLSEAACVERTARLAKADLTSLMVREKEFSSLQGYMGGEYAGASGEGTEVSNGIYEHYLPRFADDVLPETDCGTVVALADKADTLAGCFGVGLIPTGSEDPYALRRQAMGIARILIEKEIHVSLGEIFGEAIRLYGDKLAGDASELEASLLDFLRQRVQTLLTDRGFRYDLVAAVLDADIDDPALIMKRIAAVEEFERHDKFPSLITAFKRAHNITKGGFDGDPDPDLFEDDAERDLHETYQRLLPDYAAYMREKDFKEALDLLSELSAPIDVFFDRVMVMAEDEALKINRLRLLSRITHLFLAIANFSRLETS
jgi:glycyl-tRNA synthetase beta chain